jgi:hypothetical protein
VRIRLSLDKRSSSYLMQKPMTIDGAVFIRNFQAGKKNTARWPCFF